MTRPKALVRKRVVARVDRTTMKDQILEFLAKAESPQTMKEIASFMGCENLEQRKTVAKVVGNLWRSERIARNADRQYSIKTESQAAA